MIDGKNSGDLLPKPFVPQRQYSAFKGSFAAKSSVAWSSASLWVMAAFTVGLRKPHSQILF